MTLGTLVRTGFAVLGLYAAACGAVQGTQKPTLDPMRRAYINSCPDYQVDIFAEPGLRSIAGIMSRTVQVRREEGVDEQGRHFTGYAAEGSFSEFTFPEIMARTCEKADANKDGVITPEESGRLFNQAAAYAVKRDEKDKEEEEQRELRTRERYERNELQNPSN